MGNLEAWHFLADTGRIAHNVNLYGVVQPHADTLVSAGQTLRVDSLVMRGSRNNDPRFARGLHGSLTPAEALFHAKGARVCRVALSGEVRQLDRYALATERTCLWTADATQTVFRWGCWVARRVFAAAEAAGYEVPAPCVRAVAARSHWLHCPEQSADLQSFVSPVRNVMNKLDGCGTNGKPQPTRAVGPLALRRCAWTAFSLVQGDLHRMAARPAGYYDTGAGQEENAMLQGLLLRLAPTSSGRAGVATAVTEATR